MRCKCNKVLSDFEATRKVAGTNEYLDMCNKCFHASGLAAILPIQERADLRTEDDDADQLCDDYYDDGIPYESP